MTVDFMDFINAQVRAESAQEFHAAGGITLGQMIDLLEAAPHMGADMNATVQGLVSPDSYRGYYERLAFGEGPTTLAAMLKAAQDSVGQTFQGYKGGDFLMDRDTMLHVAEYGCAPDDDELTIPRLMAIIKQAQ